MSKLVTDKEKEVFPHGFLWGASTAAHQVEGGQHNDWTDWEESGADRLVQHAETFYYHNPDTKPEAGKRETYLSNAGKVDHWNRYPEDLQLAKEIGLNAYRFSVEWSRIQPERGKLNKEALAHYREMILKMHELGLTPVLTLWHFTLPKWVRDQGGWHGGKTPKLFRDFVEIVVKELGDLVHYWITLNEPGVYYSQSYLNGEWPPALRNPWLGYLTLENFTKAHRFAYNTIKRHYPNAQVSIAHNFCYYEPATNTAFNRFMTRFFRWWHNDHFMEGIKDKIDFVGVNYYFHEKVDGFKRFGNQEKRSDMNWGLSPESIGLLATEIYKRYKLPVIFTENGLADARNLYRKWYLAEVKKSLLSAIQAGTDIRGYFHWSLLDNFEWAKGYWPRFGLIAVDPVDGKRTIRDF